VTADRRAGALPPGPTTDRLTQGTLFHRDLLGFLRSNQEEFGDVFTIHLAVAGPMVVFAKPRAINQLAVSDPAHGHAGEARRKILGMVSPRSVLGADGGRHASVRARVASVFTVEAMDSRRDEMAHIAELHVAGWPRGRPFRLLQRMRALVDEVFARLVVGMRDPARARALAAATQKMLWTPGNPPLPPPGEGAGAMGELGKRLFDRRKREPGRLLRMEIESRRRAGETGDGADLIGCMLQGEPEQAVDDMVDELLPLLMAGQEPPAAGLTWLLDRLSREPGLDDEWPALPDGDPRKDAIEREALRLRPPVHSIARRMSRDAEIDGVELPRGAVGMGPMGPAAPRRRRLPRARRVPARALHGPRSRRAAAAPVRRRRATLPRRAAGACVDRHGAADRPARREAEAAVARARADGRARNRHGPAPQRARGRLRPVAKRPRR
jgi:cytochrome P450 family 135